MAVRSSLKELQSQKFDYVVIGGGTAGCLLAARLAGDSARQNSVLLVEAGGEAEDDPESLIPGLAVSKFGCESGNWLYSTSPQKDLNNRVIAYPRGRGMGGCSANNFLAWVRGPKSDFDVWAESVGDSWWRWENVLTVMKKLEDFRPQCPEGKEKYAKPTPSAHGTRGPFAVGFGQTWQSVIEHCLLAGQEAGHALNTDNNDGDPVGISIAQFNVDNGVRTTSATAFLDSKSTFKLKNLSVITKTICAKVILDNKTVTGVELLPAADDGSDTPIFVRVNKEVILSAGSFETPHILFLSGIGPPEHLASFKIPLTHHLPAVGQNLRDHTALTCEFIIDSSIAGHNQLLKNPAALKAAHEEYSISKTGPLAVFGASAAILFPRLPALFASTEFEQLPEETQRFLRTENRPSTEVWMHSGPQFYLGPLSADASVLVLEGLCQHNQSRGSLRLASKNPRVFPIIDPNYLSHPFDLRMAIETLKEMIHLANTDAFSSITRSLLHGPRSPYNNEKLASGTDEDALKDFVLNTLTQGFHCMGTCVMGKEGEENRVVGPDFKVLGAQGLRIADMSVCPILTTNHTQVNAYLIGERCAQVILGEREGEGERQGQGKGGIGSKL